MAKSPLRFLKQKSSFIFDNSLKGLNSGILLDFEDFKPHTSSFLLLGRWIVSILE